VPEDIEPTYKLGDGALLLDGLPDVAMLQREENLLVLGAANDAFRLSLHSFGDLP
jgi:hypothetical protein